MVECPISSSWKACDSLNVRKKKRQIQEEKEERGNGGCREEEEVGVKEKRGGMERRWTRREEVETK